MLKKLFWGSPKQTFDSKDDEFLSTDSVEVDGFTYISKVKENSSKNSFYNGHFTCGDANFGVMGNSAQPAYSHHNAAPINVTSSAHTSSNDTTRSQTATNANFISSNYQNYSQPPTTNYNSIHKNKKSKSDNLYSTQSSLSIDSDIIDHISYKLSPLYNFSQLLDYKNYLNLITQPTDKHFKQYDYSFDLENAVLSYF